jgi:hypothetical protein
LKQLEKKKWLELGRNVIYIRDDFEEILTHRDLNFNKTEEVLRNKSHPQKGPH